METQSASGSVPQALSASRVSLLFREKVKSLFVTSESSSQSAISPEGKKTEIENRLQKLCAICEKYELNDVEKLTDEKLSNLIDGIKSKFAAVSDEQFAEYINLNTEIEAHCKTIVDNKQEIEMLFRVIDFCLCSNNEYLQLNSDKNLSVMFNELTAASNKLAENINKLKDLESKLAICIGDDVKKALTVRADVISVLTFAPKSTDTKCWILGKSIYSALATALINSDFFNFLKNPENGNIKKNFHHLLTLEDKIEKNEQVEYLRAYKRFNEDERAAQFGEYFNSVDCIADVAENYKTNYLPLINSKLQSFYSLKLADAKIKPEKPEKTFDSLKKEITTKIVDSANGQIADILKCTTLQAVLKDVEFYDKTSDDLANFCAESTHLVNEEMLKIKAFFDSAPSELDEIEAVLSNLESLLNERFDEKNMQKFQQIEKHFLMVSNLANVKINVEDKFKAIGLPIENGDKNFITGDLNAIYAEKRIELPASPFFKLSRSVKLKIPNSSSEMLLMPHANCYKYQRSTLASHVTDYIACAKEMQTYRDSIECARTLAKQLKAQPAQSPITKFEQQPICNQTSNFTNNLNV